MATPAPIASGRYFSDVRLASCLKRMPVCAVTSANTACTELFPAAGREACASREPAEAAAELARNFRRVTFIDGARPGPGEASVCPALRTWLQVPPRPAGGIPVPAARRSAGR